MKRKIVIEYYWKCYQFKKIPAKLAECLEETAEERIKYLMAEGYVEGELFDNVMIDIDGKECPKDGYECSGWATIKKS
jgi:uncharacterized protein YoaH (UPF0181 family)